MMCGYKKGTKYLIYGIKSRKLGHHGVHSYAHKMIELVAHARCDDSIALFVSEVSLIRGTEDMTTNDSLNILMNAGLFVCLLWNIIATTAAWIKGEG